MIEPKSVNRTVLLVTATITLGALLTLGGNVAVNRARWSFEHRLSNGMSKQEVKCQVGLPATVLDDGEELPRWGNTAERRVSVETSPRRAGASICAGPNT